MRFFLSLVIIFLVFLCANGQIMASTRNTRDIKKTKSFEISGEVVFPMYGEINSSYPEKGPLTTPDGKFLFFSRQNHPENYGGNEDHEDIWYAQWDENKGHWDQPKPYPWFNNAYPNFINSFTIENGVLIAILGNQFESTKKISSGLSYSKFVNGIWTTPIPFIIEGYYNYNDHVDFSINEDGSLMVISASRFWEQEDRDLLIAQRIDSNRWSTPLPINGIPTNGNEIAPFLLEDYLFFASDSLKGFGGYDIFFSKRLSINSWSAPVNLGKRFNDKNDNIYFNYSKDRNTAFVTKSNNEGDEDIYQTRFYIEQDLYSLIDKSKKCSARSYFDLKKETFSEAIPFDPNVKFEVQNDSDNAPLEFIWSMGDGSIEYGNLIDHDYQQPGIYQINLTLVDRSINRHYYDEYNQQIVINDRIAHQLTGIPEELSREDSFSGMIQYENMPGDAVTLGSYWSFGDGNYACGDLVLHKYSMSGIYHVSAVTEFELRDQRYTLETKQTIAVK